jgi:hypothetical protein
MSVIKSMFVMVGGVSAYAGNASVFKDAFVISMFFLFWDHSGTIWCIRNCSQA